MIFKGIEICCPQCKGELEGAGNSREWLECRKCTKHFPIILEIPDLRIFPDPYIHFDDDRKKGCKVASRFHDLSFPELVEFYYSITSVVPPHHAKQYARGLMAGVSRAENALRMWNASIKKSDEAQGSCLLEIGCGTAPLLVAAAKDFQQMVGIDIAFRWLVVGKKRLSEAGLDIPLICACAEALPFPDQQFDRVIAESTIEHVKDQKQVVDESRRVLKPGGYFFLSTPNRFSVGPDPHVGILAGGYFPKRWLSAYVKRQGGIPPQRRLLSYFTLSRLLMDGGFSKPFIFLPEVSPVQREQFGKFMQIGVDLYHLALKMPILRHLLYGIGPLFHAVAQRPSDSDCPASS